MGWIEAIQALRETPEQKNVRVASERRSKKRKREEMRQEMGFFTEMLEFQDRIEERAAKSEERFLKKFQIMQEMRDEAYDDGEAAATQQAPIGGLNIDTSELEPGELAELQILDIAKQYLPQILKGSSMTSRPNLPTADSWGQASPSTPQTVSSWEGERPAPGLTESQARLMHLNETLTKAGIDLSEIDLEKVSTKHALMLQKLFSEVRRK